MWGGLVRSLFYGEAVKQSNWSRALLDRHVDEVAPLGPRAVVVLDVALPEQLVQDEPGVRRALADPAVGDDRVAVLDDSLALIELAEFVGGLECAVLVDGLRPRHGGRTRDVTAALGTLLLVSGHRDQLAGGLLRAADGNEVGARVYGP